MIYLSGPMAGIEAHNYPEFNRMAALLREKGHKVFNPAELPRMDGWEWHDYVKRDVISMLMYCDTIALMPGWVKSRGSSFEKMIAEKIKFYVMFLNSDGTFGNP